MIIEGAIRTQSKIHLSSPLDQGVKINAKGQIGAEDARIPLSRTYRSQVFGSDGRVEYPFFPANSMVGQLRRAATSLVIDALRANEQQIKRTIYRGLTCGAPDSSPETAVFLVEEYASYLMNPFIGLFGGGKRLYESGYNICDMVPVTQATLEAGLVPSDYTDKMAMFSTGDNSKPTNRITSIEIIHRRDDLLDGKATEVAQSIEDFDELNNDINQELQRKAQGAAKRAASKAGVAIDPATEEEDVSRVSMSQQSAREFIVPGVHLYCRAELKKRLTSEQLGLFVLSFTQVMNNNKFGGVSHLGYGKLNLADAAANLVFHGKEASGPLFTLENDKGVRRLRVVHPEACSAVESAQQWLSTLDAKSIEGFYLPSKIPSEKSTGKAAGKKVEAE
jgi:CRISPR type IV-associated protein Csf2